MTEEWKTVQVYKKGKLLVLEGYEVELYSQRVRSFRKSKKGRILKPSINTFGYPFFNLRYNKKDNFCVLHRIMVDTFTPENPLNLPHINHKNGVKTDCRLENLERCTAS